MATLSLTFDRGNHDGPTAYRGTTTCPTCRIPVPLVSFAGRPAARADWMFGAYRPHRCLLGGAAVVSRKSRRA